MICARSGRSTVSEENKNLEEILDKIPNEKKEQLQNVHSEESSWVVTPESEKICDLNSEY